MSHITKVKTSIKDLTTLRKTCEFLGLEVVEQKSIGNYNDRRLAGCDHFIKSKDSESKDSHTAIGLKKTKDGSFEVVADWWSVKFDHKFYEAVGQDGKRLAQEYNKTMCQNTLELQGFYKQSSERQANGVIKLVMTKLF